jgi:hypothetical protein
MSYRLRLANTNDFNNLIGFYRREHSERLPAPSPRAIGQAIEKSQLLVVSDADGIAATAGTFDVTPPSAKDFVGELAGTRVTKVLGGTQPIRKQCILIVMRVLSFVLPRIEVLDQATSDTLIVIIRKGNVKSQTNILACGFQPLDARPDWLLYDEISWTAKSASTNGIISTPPRRRHANAPACISVRGCSVTFSSCSLRIA